MIGADISVIVVPLTFPVTTMMPLDVETKDDEPEDLGDTLPPLKDTVGLWFAVGCTV